MSRPPRGLYYIVNRVLSPAGEKLAITFNGEGQVATVTPLVNAANQIWDLADSIDDRRQTITPISAPRLQVAQGSNVILTVPAAYYIWIIKNTDNGYTIRDGNITGLSRAVPGEQVNTGQGNNSEKQNWILVPASF